RSGLLYPNKAATPGRLDSDLAARDPDLAFRFPPPMRPPLATARMARATDRLRIVIHHLPKGLQAGGQAERLKTRRNVRQRLKLQRSRRNRGRCSKLVHGVALLRGISTPKPIGSSRATSLLPFQHPTGHCLCICFIWQLLSFDYLQQERAHDDYVRYQPFSSLKPL